MRARTAAGDEADEADNADEADDEAAAAEIEAAMSQRPSARRTTARCEALSVLIDSSM